jgi:hypothetical protein
MLNQSIGGTSRGSRRNSGMSQSEYDRASPTKIDDNRSRRRVITPEHSMADDISYGGRSRRVQFEEIKINHGGEDRSQIQRSMHNSPLKHPVISPTKSQKYNSSMGMDGSYFQFDTKSHRSPGRINLAKVSDESALIDKSFYKQHSSPCHLKASFFLKSTKDKKSNIRDSKLNYTIEQYMGDQSLLSETFASGTMGDHLPAISLGIPTVQSISGPCYSLFDFIFPMGAKAKFCKLSDMSKIGDAVIWDILKKFQFEETPNPVIILSGGRETYREK